LFSRNPSKASAGETGGLHTAAHKQDRGGSGEATPRETQVLIDGFLAGELDAVRTLAGWAKTVADHEAWGFETSEDIVQATLLALLQNLREGRFAHGNLRAYVRRIAKNMCITSYRKMQTRGDHLSIEEDGQTPAASRSGDDIERLTMLEEVLVKLNETCRQILLLAYIQGFSRSEIGERLGISEDAARVRLFRCVRTARAMIEGESAVDVEHA
jgi:RNA polymerase sigma factor (sigma-70 family)